jgi:hypothetical protein
MNQQIRINLTTSQMEAVKIHWRDPEVAILTAMLLVGFILMGTVAWIMP